MEVAFRQLMELMPEGVAVHADGRLLYVNPRLATLLGYDDREGLVGRSWRDFVHPDELAHAEERLEAFAQLAPGSTERVEQRLVGRGGAVLHVELVAVRISIGARPANMVLVHDLKERRRFEAQLKHADHLAAVGRLAAGVAHEINNPLAYVIGNLVFAKQRISELTPDNLDAARAGLLEAVAEAHQGVERMRQVVSDLKTFTRKDEGQLTLVDLRAVMESTLKIMQAEIRHRARLRREYASTPRVRGNQTRLAQVFINLLMNAAQAIPEGRVDQHEIVVALCPDAQGNAVIEVSDTGVGISASMLPRVIEPFFTTKPVGFGTGLGLSVCRNIVEGYGGTISIDSVVERGTTVRVTLPASPADYVPRTRSGTTHAVRVRPYRVLVVDDDAMVLRAIKRMLRNHDVTCATSGREAIEVLMGSSKFDVIVCDLMMPELTGMDVYDRLAELGTGIERRMVFLSGGVFTERARAFLQSVPNLRFGKPIEPDRLELALAEAVEALRDS